MRYFHFGVLPVNYSDSEQGSPAWADETATLECFSKSFHIEPGKSGLSGTFSVAASKRSYQVFVVSVFRIEFFATVYSFLPVFKAIVTDLKI